jgi:uncharacterized repeat protein (TIGR04138 family)
MGQNAELYTKITRLADMDRRYRKEAYLFILAALEYTVDKLQEVRHLTGAELSRGIADYARIQYGFMAQNVLEYWGMKQTLDFGEVVFNLIGEGLLRKSEEDRKEDFDGVYEFNAEFTWEKMKPITFPEHFE